MSVTKLICPDCGLDVLHCQCVPLSFLKAADEMTRKWADPMFHVRCRTSTNAQKGGTVIFRRPPLPYSL